ncbi:MAG: DnaJ domain-containing protein [Bacteroidota bacterium]
MQNHYATLGLAEDCTTEEVRAAFKKLAVRYHPDKNLGQNTEEEFKAINEAYQVLSNPYERARHDLTLKYGAADYSTVDWEEGAPPRKQRTAYSAAPIDYKQNWEATAWAFGFTFVVATVIMTGVWIHNYFERQAYEEYLAERRTKFEMAQQLESRGQLEQSLGILSDLGVFHRMEKDMETYQRELLDMISEEGQEAFDEQRYRRAIYYFEIFDKFAPIDKSSLKEELAICYQYVNQPQESIRLLNELVTSGYRHIETYLRLAQIHRDQLGDHEMSLRYFEVACEVAINYYKQIYGNAYLLVVTQHNIPDLHYRLFTEMADVYLINDLPEKAISATRWNIQTWPDSAANYAIAARGYEELGEINRACDFYQTAARLDRTLSAPVFCR